MDHVLAPELAEEDLREARFEILARDDAYTVLPGTDRVEWLILAKKP